MIFILQVGPVESSYLIFSLSLFFRVSFIVCPPIYYVSQSLFRVFVYWGKNYLVVFGIGIGMIYLH